MIDENDRYHRHCVTAAELLPVPLLTSPACWTEAMYLLNRSAGYPGQKAIWEYREAKALEVEPLSDEDLDRARHYSDRFRDVPCDFWDATILALRERHGTYIVFTLDRHFHAYRVNGKPLHVEPGLML